MLKRVSPFHPRTVVLGVTLMLCSGLLQAQNHEAQDDSRCQATNNDNLAGKNADMDGTYNACRLVNGKIGYASRPNTGNSENPGFDKDNATPSLRKPQFDNSNHQLSNPYDDSNTVASGGNGRRLRAYASPNFGARDFIAQPEDENLLPEAGGYRGGQLASRAAPEYASLLRRSPETGSDSGYTEGGAGGGGAGGGLDSGGSGAIPNVPTIPAVPEPSSYAMIVAGLALMGFAARRKRAKKTL
ncbi:MAG: PEP-CTERM sorting domain-containing protein [Janthinobacterium sp.]|jgi:uncharacterized membrane protein YgcG